MPLVWAVGVVLAFALAVERMRLPRRAREVGRRAGACVRALRDPSIADEEKERRLRREALRLFRLFAILAGGGLAALAAPLGVVWLLDLLGLASLDAVLGVLERVDFLAAVTVAGAVAYGLLRRAGDA